MKRTKYITDNRPEVPEDLEFSDNPHFIRKLENGDFVEVTKGRMRYKSTFMRQVYYLAKFGASDADMGDFFGVQTGTIQTWKDENPKFREAYQEGKWMFGLRVNETLGQRCLGYDYTEIEVAEHVDRQGRKRTLKKVTHKHMPPDVTAIMFYLKNRFRQTWSDTNRLEIDAKLNVDIVAKNLSLDTLTEQERALVKSIAIKNVSTIHGVSTN